MGISLSVPRAGPSVRFRYCLSRHWPALLLTLGIALATQLLLGSRAALAQAPVVFAATSAQNLFPAGIALETEVSTTASPIVSAGLVYQAEGAPTGAQRVSLPVNPGKAMTLRYTWDTRPAAVPPGAVIACHWEVTDASGNQATSPTARFTYEDSRFRWKWQRSAVATIWSHDQPDVVAETALDLANQAVEYQHRIFQTSLPGPIQIRLYNTHAELAAWQPALPGFSGGRGFPGLGITAQVALPGRAQADWLAAVIPHEISRLYFYQATAGAAAAPRWLDEGLALYNEATGHDDEERLLQVAVVRRDLLPLAGLASALDGSDESRVRLAQAEALSAVRYLIYRDGPDRLVSLLAGFRAGRDADTVFTQALGRPPAVFEDEWLMWVGVPAVWRQTADPEAASTTVPGSPPTPVPLSPGQAPPPTPDEQAAEPTDGGTPRLPPLSLLIAILLAALFLPALTTRRRRP
ncbi:MAG TPA: hypothetical protein VGA61_05805 [Anaerolineae bacterium]